VGLARVRGPLGSVAHRLHRGAIGDVVYWPPGPHVAVFYGQDGRTLREPGMIRLGAVDGSAEAFAAGSSVQVVIERAD